MDLMSSLQRPRHAIMIATVGAAVAACSAFDRKNIVATPFDAASVKVSVISVARWDDVYEQLRPKFKLTGDAALAKVLPQTAAFSRRQLDAFAAGLSIGSADASADATALEEENEEDGGGDSDDGDDSGTAPALPTTPDPLSLNGSLSKEPIIEYKAATTLFQEVQLLNEYLNHAVIPKDHVPYLVRLQLAVLPLRRNQPFDIFTDLNFLNEEDFYSDDLPKVVPLLVTDSLESAREDELAQIARNISLLGSGTSGGTPFAAALQRLNNRIDERQNVDLNALFTISQITDNSVRLRLGARYDGRNDYEMTARTHNITLLVTVPYKPDLRPVYIFNEVKPQRNDPRRLEILASSALRDARTGKILEEGPSTSKELRKRLQRIAKEFPLEDKIPPENWNYGQKYCIGEKGNHTSRVKLKSTEEVLRKLLYRYVFYDDYSRYSNAVYCMTYDEKYGTSATTPRDEKALWLELSSLAGSIPRNYVTFELPGFDDPNYSENPIGNVFFIADDTNLSKTAQCCDASFGNCYRKNGIRFVNGVMTDDQKATKVASSDCQRPERFEVPTVPATRRP